MFQHAHRLGAARAPAAMPAARRRPARALYRRKLPAAHERRQSHTPPEVWPQGCATFFFINLARIFTKISI